MMLSTVLRIGFAIRVPERRKYLPNKKSLAAGALIGSWLVALRLHFLLWVILPE